MFQASPVTILGSGSNLAQFDVKMRSTDLFAECVIFLLDGTEIDMERDI